MNRRAFLQTTAMSSLGLALSRHPLMAGPFTREDFEHLVPADKKLQPAWVKSLFERGTPEVLRGTDLKFVGMPVGGLFAGQLYLGGDGRLWHWDIFNKHTGTGDAHYARPLVPQSPVAQRFTLAIGDQVRPLDREGFSDIAFRGEYPIGIVNYADPAVPLTVRLEAFSPFIPLDENDSGLPATILRFTLKNPTALPVEATLSGELENPVCLRHLTHPGLLRNRIVRAPGFTSLHCSAEPSPASSDEVFRPDLPIEDWSGAAFTRWKVEGTAFGSAPVALADLPADFRSSSINTAHLVHSFVSAPGVSNKEKDSATGRLVSPPFVIERHHLLLSVAGDKPNTKSRHGVTLFVDDKPVVTLGGERETTFYKRIIDVRAYAGKTARIEVVDNGTRAWGWIACAGITQTDRHLDQGPLEKLSDFGTLDLALLGAPADATSAEATCPFGEKLPGSLARRVTLAPGAETEIVFVLAWRFPNLSIQDSFEYVGRHYATRFASSNAVVEYIVAHHDRLVGLTRLWRDTWYDSTLPYWLLDRTLLNASILASSTCYRFADGRFYGWEGVGCCKGTCGHVYHYAHSTGRLFPAIERDTRERVDFGLALQPDGAIRFRGEFNDIPAIDAQAGTILRALREHQMCADDAFLRRNWPAIKRSTRWLIDQDANADGLIESGQHNTLDSHWYGAVAWLSGLYLASLHAAARLADLVGDTAFARECRAIAETGKTSLTQQLFDGDYFINRLDPAHLDAINSGTGCAIDQVFGQSWAFQVGLPRVIPKEETLAALRSLWRYNFSPDVGPYRAANKAGRWYAMPGEAGLLMCTFPRRDWDLARAAGKGNPIFVGYFNECMNGFEYQVAGHMLWEGMVLEGLAITRAVHDRYHASKRNPWNEVECGDHYARSMASHGVYLAACGYDYDGPAGHIGFAPKLTPEDFRCAFTAAEGWGTFSQRHESGGLSARVQLRHGRLRLATFSLALPASSSVTRVTATLGTTPVPAAVNITDGRALITFATPQVLSAGTELTLSLA